MKNGVPRKEDFEVGNIQRFQSPEPSPKKLDVGVAQIAHPLPTFPGPFQWEIQGSDCFWPILSGSENMKQNLNIY